VTRLHREIDLCYFTMLLSDRSMDEKRARFWSFFRDFAEHQLSVVKLSQYQHQVLRKILPTDRIRSLSYSNSVEDWKQLIQGLLVEIAACSALYSVQICNLVNDRGIIEFVDPQDAVIDGDLEKDVHWPEIELCIKQFMDRLYIDRWPRDCAFILRELYASFVQLLLNYVKSDVDLKNKQANMLSVCPTLVKYSKTLKTSDGRVLIEELLHVDSFKKLAVSHCLIVFAQQKQ
jgi:hypothetical protein